MDNLSIGTCHHQVLGYHVEREKNDDSSEKSNDGSEKKNEMSCKSTDINKSILDAIKLNKKISAAEIAMQLGLSARAVEKRIRAMRESGAIRRVGPDKGGHWEVITSPNKD